MVNALCSEMNHDHRDHGGHSWPHVISDEMKDDVVRSFRRATSTNTLATFYCASCSGEYPQGTCMLRDANDVDLSVLRRPDWREVNGSIVDSSWYTGTANPVIFGIDSGFEDVHLDLRSVMFEANGLFVLQLCMECDRYLRHHRTPPLSLANRVVTGDVPPVLQDLTAVEEAMISRSRAKAWILWLNERTDGDATSNHQ
jgi:hypothetical protein